MQQFDESNSSSQDALAPNEQRPRVLSRLRLLALGMWLLPLGWAGIGFGRYIGPNGLILLIALASIIAVVAGILCYRRLIKDYPLIKEMQSWHAFFPFRRKANANLDEHGQILFGQAYQAAYKVLILVSSLLALGLLLLTGVGVPLSLHLDVESNIVLLVDILYIVLFLPVTFLAWQMGE